MQPYHRIRNRQLCKPDGGTSFADERGDRDANRSPIVLTNYWAATRRPCGRCSDCRARRARRASEPTGPADRSRCRCNGCLKSFRRHFVGGRR